MSDGLQYYSFKGQQVRVVVIDGEPWFVVKDLAEVLCVKTLRSNARRVLKGERMRLYDVPAYSIRGAGMREEQRKTLLTDESGMYRAVLRSDKAEAREFQHWITSDVLPSIRATGSYTSCVMRKLNAGSSESVRAVVTGELVATLTISGSVAELSKILSKLKV